MANENSVDKSYRDENDSRLLPFSPLRWRPLPDGLKYHCFLSYKQSSAIDLVGKQYYILTNRGFKCWYDNLREDTVTLDNMREGISSSMVYCLFLSKDVFPSSYIEKEVEVAISLKKPIMFLRHPDTGTQGYWSFVDYIDKAPNILKPYFIFLESIHLGRSGYEQDFATEQIVSRLENIRRSLFSEDNNHFAASNSLMQSLILLEDINQVEPTDSIKQQADNAKIKKMINEDVRVPYARTKLMFVGQGRAGKTSTIKKLMRSGFDPKEESTKGFDVTMVQSANWTEAREAHFMAEFLRNAISSNNIESNTGQETSETNHLSLTNDNEKDKRPKKSPEDEVFSSSMKTEREHVLSDEEMNNYRENIADSVSFVKLMPEVSEEEVRKYGDIVFTGENKLSFSIWDFGGQEVFYTLHHLFLTEYGCYILVFDMTKVIAVENRDESLEFIKFWLFSKKIHAPLAPLIIVGTHSTEVDSNGKNRISDLINENLLDLADFNEYVNGKLCFFPIDNMVDEGIDMLRDMIEKVVGEQSYVKGPVNSSFLRVLDHLLQLEENYLNLEDADEIIAICGLDKDKFEEALYFLNSRGLLNYIQEPPELRNFIILQPQWLINGITAIVFDEDAHDPPKFDRRFKTMFKRFTKDRILDDNLLIDIWTKKGYSAKVQNFFRTLMLKANVMCEYNFSKKKRYLVPRLFSAANNPGPSMGLSKFKGNFFIIDFSGTYDEKMDEEDDGQFVKYLPFGLFERLVCLCVEHSSTFEEKLKPKLNRESAILTFGNKFKYELKINKSTEAEGRCIKVTMDEKCESFDAIELVKRIYDMISSLSENYFSNEINDARLAISLLIPADNGVLEEYESIRKRKEKKTDEPFWPRTQPGTIKPSAFNFWFNEKQNESLTEPYLAFERQFKKDRSLKCITDVKTRQLPHGLKYHCFLSYKQSAAIDVVAKQYYILTGRGYKCWYDMQFREGDLTAEPMLFNDDLTLENMREGVRSSMMYCLHLSKDIFPVHRVPGEIYYIDEEVKMAINEKKPIMLLTHPDTGTHGYWSFGDYINYAPAELKPYFKEIESIQLRRRYYEEDLATQRIINILEKALNGLLNH